MELAIIGVAFIAMLCVLFDKISARLGIPMLLAFILLGMIFGSDGLFKIEFEDFKFAEQFCSIALIFIIFYGGFGTNWREGRRVAPPLGPLTRQACFRCFGLKSWVSNMQRHRC